MGAVHQREPDPVTTRLGGVIRHAHRAMLHATAALLAAGPSVTDSVTAADGVLHELRDAVEEHAAVILAARERPISTDLAAILAGVHVNADAERMGELAREVTKIARSRPSRSPIPPRQLDVVREMSEISLDVAGRAGDMLESPGAGSVAELVDRGEEIRRLRWQLYRDLLSEQPPPAADAAIDVTLAGRCYAHYAEHAVSVARHAVLFRAGALEA